MARAYHNTKPMGDLPEGAAKDAVKIEFARRLQQAMADRGLNQSELARRAAEHMPSGEFGRYNISNYIVARALPGPAHLKALCDALGVGVQDLLPSRGVPSADDRAPAMDVRSLGDGRAWLRVNQALDWPTALKVMSILKGDDGD